MIKLLSEQEHELRNNAQGARGCLELHDHYPHARNALFRFVASGRLISGEIEVAR